MNDAIKAAVLDRLKGGPWKQTGQTSYRFRAGVVHARFKTSAPFSFNINPATLRADYELWICGSQEFYYLLPRHLLNLMYTHPSAYVDKRHPNIRVVSLDVQRHHAKFARGAASADIRPYFLSSLEAPLGGKLTAASS